MKEWAWGVRFESATFAVSWWPSADQDRTCGRMARRRRRRRGVCIGTEEHGSVVNVEAFEAHVFSLPL